MSDTMAQATKSRFVKASDGVRIHYVEAGKGVPARASMAFRKRQSTPKGVGSGSVPGIVVFNAARDDQ